MNTVNSSALRISAIKRFLLQSTLFWLVLWLFAILNNYQAFTANGTAFTWQFFFSWNTPYYFVMIGATPLIYLLYHSRSQNSYLSQIASHIMGGLLLALIQRMGINLYSALFVDIEFFEPGYTLIDKMVALYKFNPLLLSVTGFLFYLLGLGLVIFLDIYQRFRQNERANYTLETALSKARFDMLQSQLQPHFLFNTFNSLSMMARQQRNEEVVDMIAMVSNLLRETLNLEDQQKVTLEREMELVNHYLKIEQVRFRDRLSIETDISEGSEKVLVPVLFMQPLVENAFQHGISKKEGKAGLMIRADIRNQQLVIEIINSGPTLPPDFNLNEQMGIGIGNVLQRLEHAYGENYEFSIDNRSDNEGVITTVTLPV